MIRTNIRGGKYSNIFKYPNICHTMSHTESNPLIDLKHLCMYTINLYNHLRIATVQNQLNRNLQKKT